LVNKDLDITHKRKTSNALYAPVRSEHKRFQLLSEFVSANTRIAQVSGKEFHTDGPTTEKARQRNVLM